MGRLRSFTIAAAVATATGLGLVPLAPAPAGAAVAVTPSVDPTDRASVLAGYQASLVEARAVPSGWTGGVDSCSVGSESAASIAATRGAVNYYRALNRLGPITMDPTMNRAALTGATLMQANGALTHDPPRTWRCWSQAGADAAGTSNLMHGVVGARAVDAYMSDPGATNSAAGHRRWVLDPRARTFGTGSTTSANALSVFGPVVARPAGVTWVAWPNAGFVPKQVVPPLFSLSSNQYPDADYSAASVSVKVGATALPVTKHPLKPGYGDTALTWQVGLPAGFATSPADVRFDIRVSGIRTRTGGALPTHAYSSTAVAAPVVTTAPGAPGAPTAVGAAGQVTVSWTAASTGGSAITGYQVTPYAAGVAQPVRTFTAGSTRGVVTGLSAATTYTFRVRAVNAIGAGALSAPSTTVMPPYASSEHFVDQAHRRMVGRPATAAELSRWVGPLGAGTTTPSDVIASLRTARHQTTAVDPVTRLYMAYFLRTPDPDGLRYWVAQRAGGRSLVSISAFFSRSAEFDAEYGTLTARAFVELVYENILGRDGEAAGVEYWTGELDAGRRSRGSVMLGFSESREYTTRQASEVTVSVLYLMLLDRPATRGELTAGVTALDRGTTTAAVTAALLPRVAVLT